MVLDEIILRCSQKTKACRAFELYINIYVLWYIKFWFITELYTHYSLLKFLKSRLIYHEGGERLELKLVDGLTNLRSFVVWGLDFFVYYIEFLGLYLSCIKGQPPAPDSLPPEFREGRYNRTIILLKVLFLTQALETYLLYHYYVILVNNSKNKSCHMHTCIIT